MRKIEWIGVAFVAATGLVAACTRDEASRTVDRSAGGGSDESAPLVEAPPLICQRYVKCVARERPLGLARAEAVFGPSAPCWEGRAEGSLCEAACRAAARALPACGDCDEDDACTREGDACVDHICAPRACRLDARRIEALIDRTCACKPSCSSEAAFLHELATAARARGCAEAFDAWSVCEVETLVCRDGHVDIYASCARELEALATCENRGEAPVCPGGLLSAPAAR